MRHSTKTPNKASSSKQTFDPVWLDEQYNNRARVASSAQIMARWAQESKLARAQSVCRLDIPYGDGSDRSLGLNETLDIFPSTNSHAPVLVFVHGGYWRALDKSDQSFIAPAFTKHGACVVIPNYALCPQTDGVAVSIPDITLQMVNAVAWVYQNIARYGGDPQRITVVGHSAGGHLAAMLLGCAWDLVGRSRRVTLPSNVVKAAVSISGVHDLAPIAQTPFLQSALRLTPQQIKQASPIHVAKPDQGQLHCFVGEAESAEFQRQNGLMQQAWGVNRVPTAHSLLGGYHHFSVLDQLCDGRSPLNHCVKELIA